MSSGFKTLSFELTGVPPVIPLELKHLSLEAEFEEVVVGNSERLKAQLMKVQVAALLIFLLFAGAIGAYIVLLLPKTKSSLAELSPIFGGVFVMVLSMVGLALYRNKAIEAVRRHCEEVNTRPNVSGRAQFTLRVESFTFTSGSGKDKSTHTEHWYYIDVECSVDGSRVPCAPLDPRSSEGARLLGNENAVYGQDLV